MKCKPVTHVIFDMDGLLVDSEIIYDKVISEMARQHGKEYTLEAKLKVIGTPEEDTARIAIKEMDLPLTLEEFLETFRAKAIVELGNVALMPGVEKLVRHLHKNNIPIAIATSSSEEAMNVKIQKYKDLFKLFHHAVCGTTDTAVKHGKPAPDIFLICASRFPDNPKPSQCLVLEDAPNGVKGARSAGMQVVMVPQPDVSMELRKLATLALNSLTEFQPELFGLPPY